VFDRQPELRITQMPHRIFGTPIVAEMPVAATSFRSRVEDTNTITEKTINRLDLRPSLSLPFSPVSAVNIMPVVTYNYTQYNLTGETADSPKTVSKEYYTVGAVMEGPRLYRVFDAGETALKHTITPSLNFIHVPGYEVDGKDRQNVPSIDYLDESTPVSSLRLQILQRVLTKTGDTGAGRQIVRFNATQGYDFREANRSIQSPQDERRPLSTLFMDLDTNPTSWLVLNGDAAFNHYEHDYDTMSLEVGLKLGEFAYLSYDRRFTRKPKSVFHSGLAGINLTSKLTVEGSVRYDEVEKYAPNTLLEVRYKSCCWGVSVYVEGRRRVEETAAGEFRQIWDNKFFVMFSLKGLGEHGIKPPTIMGRKI